LIHHDDSYQSPSANTIVKELKALTLKNSPYANETWYYGSMSRDEAEKYLKSYGHDRGDYLIRDSERRVCSRTFVVTSMLTHLC
jgi:hypothetical protein